jgi:hypothetical protein
MKPMPPLLVATRKGLFVLRSEAGQWAITAHHFKGEPVSQVLADARSGHWYAALNLGHFGVKLHKSVDQGGAWSEIAAPAFPPKPTEGPWADDTTPWSVELIWSLATGGPDEPDTLWAGCIPAGLFKSTDGGATWAVNAPLWAEPRRRDWAGGGYDHAGIHSILVDPRDSKHITLAVSCGGVWQSFDGGATWALNAKGMKADYLPAETAGDENAQDPHALVQCAAAPDVLWVQHHCGIYKSVDGARSWQGIGKGIEAPAPSGFGFAVAVDPNNAERAWFVPAQADACRIPVDGRMVVNRTDDGGKTFTTFGDGLPQIHAFHLAYRHGLDVSADGQTLALGTTTGGLWVSANAGENWQGVSRDFPPIAALKFAQ